VIDKALIAFLLAACGWGLYAWGEDVGASHEIARAAIAEKKAVEKAVDEAQLEYEARVRENAAFAQALQRRVRAAESALTKVKRETQHVPIVIAPRVAEGGPVCADASLTHGAVRLWNTALAGADVPAAACGVDGADPAACAVGAGISVERAHANAVENFSRFGVCVARLDALQAAVSARERIHPEITP
jgi:hypothetical protein